MDTAALPSLFSALSRWLHLASLILWIGTMAFFLFVFAPAVRALSPGAGARALDRGRRIFEILSWIAIHALLLSGVANLVMRWPAGGFSPGSPYGSILAIKLALFAAMLFHHCLQAFRYAPSITSLTTGAGPESEAWPPPLIEAWRKWFRLLKINAAIGPVVVLLGLALAGLSK